MIIILGTSYMWEHENELGYSHYTPHLSKACTSRFRIRFGCTSASYVSSLHQNHMLITVEFSMSHTYQIRTYPT